MAATHRIGRFGNHNLAKAGEVSGYDRRRLEREAQTARARVAGIAADYARGRETLAGLTGEPAGQGGALGGEGLPDVLPPFASVQDALRRRPDLASLDAQAEAFDRDRAVAERSRIPDITLGLGQKRIDEPNRTDNGVILAFSMAIPLFDRGQAGQQRAQAQASAQRWGIRHLQRA